MQKHTESTSPFDHLEKMSTQQLLNNINALDSEVPAAVAKIIPNIEAFVDDLFTRMSKGGRLFYCGAGTSGRLGVVDASECPPTFGVPHGMVVGLIAGGDRAIRKAVEFAEDDQEQGWRDLQEFEFAQDDTLLGIAASGTTPYVLGAIAKAREIGSLTGGLTCNPGSPLALNAKHALVPEVGPEFVTGSTRMRSGTAQKLVLNMISTSVMIKLGRVKGNRMVDMQLSNNKLVDRGTRMVMETLDIDYEKANAALKEFGSVRKTIEALKRSLQ